MGDVNTVFGELFKVSVPKKDNQVVRLPGPNSAEPHPKPAANENDAKEWFDRIIPWVELRFGKKIALCVAFVILTVWFARPYMAELQNKYSMYPSSLENTGDNGKQDSWEDVMAGVGSALTLQPYEVGVNASGELSEKAFATSCNIRVQYRDFIGADGGSAPIEGKFSVKTYSNESSKLDIFFHPKTASRLKIDSRHPSRIRVHWDCPASS